MKCLLKISIIVTTLALLALLATSESCSATNEIKFTCTTITNVSLAVVDHVLACIADNSIISTLPNSSVSLVVHRDGSKVENLTEIKTVWIRNSLVKFVPSGIKNKFVNTRAFIIYSSGLLSVKKNNLMPFGDSLEYLDLYDNLLTSIDSDLFQYNPSLKVLSLDRNPIRHIEPGFFESLEKINLEWAKLTGLACMDSFFQTLKGDDIATFVWNNESCFDEDAKTESHMAPINAQIEQSRNSEKCLDDKLTSFKASMIDDFKEITDKIDAQIDSLKLANENLAKKFKHQIELMEKKLQTLMDGHAQKNELFNRNSTQTNCEDDNTK